MSYSLSSGRVLPHLLPLIAHLLGLGQVVDVAKALPPMEAQRRERHVARINIDVRATQPWTSIRFAMDVKRVEMGVAPREDDLQCGMEGGQGYVAADKEPAPDQRTDALHDHTELIDARGGCMRGPWEERTAGEPRPQVAPPQ